VPLLTDRTFVRRSLPTSRDPLDGVPGTAVESNPYHYTQNDPVNHTDPSGMRMVDAAFSAFAGIGFCWPPWSCPDPIQQTDDCASDSALPTSEEISAWGVQGVSVEEERALQVDNCRDDYRNGFKDTRGSKLPVGGKLGSLLSAAIQAKICLGLVLESQCALAAWAAPIATTISVEIKNEEPPGRLSQTGAMNATRHFAWVFLVALKEATGANDKNGIRNTLATTSIHEVFQAACNGTANECRWDNEADKRNNYLGAFAGASFSGRDPTTVRQLAKDVTKAFLEAGVLDLRRGCPSRYHSVPQGC